QNVEVGLQVLRADRSDDCRVQVRVRESEAENELHRGHAIEQVIEMCPAPAFPLQPGLLSLGWRSLCCAAANDDACTLLSSSGDRSFVLTLDRRVRDLKDVKNAHRDVVDQVGQGARHADKSHLAGLSELEKCIECAVLLKGLPGWRGVELHDIEIVGFHPRKTLFDPG